MNNIITIPQKLASIGDLALVSKREFEEFSKWKKSVRVSLDERWFWTHEWQKKEAEADDAIHSGGVYGPFQNYREVIFHLRKSKK